MFYKKSGRTTHAKSVTINYCEKILGSPFFLSAFFMTHGLLMNGYKFGWWKNLVIHAYYLPAAYTRVDPSLYPRDLFVNTMKQGIINSSYFWEAVAYLLKIFPQEPLIFTIYIIGLYSIYLSLLYCAQTLFENKLASCGTLILYSFGLRQCHLGSSAIYLNFLHSAVVGMPLCILSITFFLKKQYRWAFLLCGILFNIHAMYTSFLLIIFCMFFIFRPDYLSIKELPGYAFYIAVPAIPSLLFIIPQLGLSWGGQAWMTGIKWTHWVHDFPSYWQPVQYGKFLAFLLLFAVSVTGAKLSKIRTDALLLIPGICMMCLAGTIFSELIPSPLIIKLQLWRSLWIFVVIAIIFISNFLVESWKNDFFSRFSVIALAIILTGYTAYKNSMPPDFGRIPFWLVPVFTLYLFIAYRFPHYHKVLKIAKSTTAVVFMVIIAARIIPPLSNTFLNIGDDHTFVFFCVGIFLAGLQLLENVYSSPVKRYQLYSVAFLVFLSVYDTGLLWRQHGAHIDLQVEQHKSAYPWIDIQLFCRDNTPKDALIIVPPYMQGFRLFSQRSTFGDWLDGMLINWTNEDYAIEWLKRMRSLGWTRVKGEWSSYNNLSTDDFLKIANNYGADYIVTEKVLHLKLPVVYKNKKYVLYKVQSPIPDIQVLQNK